MKDKLAHIARYRLQNQQISRPTIPAIKTVATWMGATQAQDYAQAKWAFGLRLPGSTDTDIEAAIDRGDIIRTHVLRPTWHFVAPEDLRWMLALSAPQVQNAMASANRYLGLDASIFQRSQTILARSLQGGQHLTKEVLMAELKNAGIPTDDIRGAHIMMQAELDGVVCNGIRSGKKITYALIDERVPPGKTLERPEAIAELGRRYFRSHGPATLQDFYWWSGLKMADARAGLEAAQPELVPETIGEHTFWLPNDFREQQQDKPTLYLMPAFDEFLVSYKDRAASIHPSRKAQAITVNGIFKPVIVQNAWVHGIWQRQVKKNNVAIHCEYFESDGEVDATLLEEAKRRLEQFYGG